MGLFGNKKADIERTGETSCAACGRDGADTKRDGSPMHTACKKKTQENIRANQQIDRNVARERSKPYDVPNSPYRPCEKCGVRGPLRDTTGGQVCASGCSG